MNWEFVIQLQENRAAVRFRSGLEGSQNNLHTNIGIITYITASNFFFLRPKKMRISTKVEGTLNRTTQKSHKKNI